MSLFKHTAESEETKAVRERMDKVIPKPGDIWEGPSKDSKRIALREVLRIDEIDEQAWVIWKHPKGDKEHKTIWWGWIRWSERDDVKRVKASPNYGGGGWRNRELLSENARLVEKQKIDIGGLTTTIGAIIRAEIAEQEGIKTKGYTFIEGKFREKYRKENKAPHDPYDPYTLLNRGHIYRMAKEALRRKIARNKMAEMAKQENPDD